MIKILNKLIKLIFRRKMIIYCHVCNKPIGTDGRRKYCDNHHSFVGGKWGEYRKKGYIKNYFKKYNLTRMR